MIKVRIVKRIDEDVENEAINFVNKSEFELACHNNTKGYSTSQLEMLNHFHDQVDKLRLEVERLKKEKVKLDAENRKLQQSNKPLDQVQLFHYCNHLNAVAKGKFGDKK